MRRRLPFFLTLAALLGFIALWWIVTARLHPPASELSEPKLAGRGDVLVVRLNRRLGTLWTPARPAPDTQPLKKAKRLASYIVHDGNLQAPSSQRISRTHQRAWDSVTRLLPPELMGDIGTFALATDGRGGGRGWLTPPQPQPGKGWQLALDPRDSAAVTRLNTLVYQSASLLALAPQRLQVLPAGDPCPTVQTNAGCVQADSLLHRYVRTFWPDDLLRDWRQRQITKRPERAQAFFNSHPDTFLNASAARGPEQDFATSWTAFVLGPRPKHAETDAQRKVAFFYSDPELTALRLSLLRRISSAFPDRS